jgi:hypothetical protein
MLDFAKHIVKRIPAGSSLRSSRTGVDRPHQPEARRQADHDGFGKEQLSKATGKVATGQKEMLLEISGKQPAKERRKEGDDVKAAA